MSKLKQIREYCVKQCHELNEKKNFCEEMIAKKQKEKDWISADNWNNDWHRNVDKFAAIQDVINKIDEVMNEQQN